jgi:protein-L-isoaspartate O-methyltransferase
LWYQLKSGGRMFIPIEFNGKTNIYIIDKPIKYKNLGEMTIQKDLNVKYVPLQK